MAQVYAKLLIRNVVVTLDSVLKEGFVLEMEASSELQQLKTRFELLENLFAYAVFGWGLNWMMKDWMEDVVILSEKVKDVLEKFLILKKLRERFPDLVGSSLAPLYSIHSHNQNLEYTYVQSEDDLLSHEIHPLKLLVDDIIGEGPHKHQWLNGQTGICNEGCFRDASFWEQMMSAECKVLYDDNFQDQMQLTLCNDESDFVGREIEVKTLSHQLLGTGEQHEVISIVGPRGVGKTALAMNVYDAVKDGFDYSLWICASGMSHRQDILRTLTGEIMELNGDELNSVDTETIYEQLELFLSARKFIIVVDDLYEEHDIGSIINYLPDVRNGSRILITTHFLHIATSISKTPFLLQPLSEKASFDLFMRRVFPNIYTTKEFAEDLKNVGRDLVHHCGGLPLALIVLGGTLSTKEKTNTLWVLVSSRLAQVLYRHPKEKRLLWILHFCFYMLAPELKWFFVNLSSFPKQHEINSEKLIRLWVAQGLITSTHGLTEEETAKRYLIKLIHIGLVQISKRLFWGEVETCQLHDFVLSFTMVQAMCSNLFHIRSANVMVGHADPSLVRYFVMHHKCDSNIDQYSFQYVRSYLNFGFHPEVDFSMFELLRVLDLEGAGITNLSLEIGALMHLRYLGLRRNPLKDLPSTVSSLKLLQTLDLRDTDISSLPHDIWLIVTLRHIYGSVFKVPSSIESLKNLQTLQVVMAGYWMKNSLAQLTALHTLKLHSSESLKDMPYDCLALPPCLVEVHLSWTKLQPNFFEMLGMLHCLKLLSLTLMDFRKITCKVGSFPKLQVLELKNLWRLKKWTLEHEAMQNLTYLVIERCQCLLTLPVGLQKGATLRHLKISHMPSNFRTQLKESGKNSLF